MKQEINVVKEALEYDHQGVEKKWREIRGREKTFSVDLDNAENPYYNLMMFPYPSAEGLHVGNFYAFTGSDINGRYHRIKGYDVFEPMGWDAFGIHSENYAKKIGSHPITETPKNVANFKRQFSELGALNDWDNEINTTSPEYYRWNQWLFLKMFEKGLAYKKMSLVNWCPDCQTVISNEQVIDGKCERHGDTDVEKKEMEQWFLRITDYAGDLFSSLDMMDWSHRTKVTQQNWIGEQEGFDISFKVEGLEDVIETFTTRIDTIYGVTFLAVSCDSELADKIVSEGDKITLDRMRQEKAFSRKEKEKEGILTDIKVLHPLTGESIPVYIANYVEGSYGTGSVMGVPSCDERDKDFADKYSLDVIDVYEGDGDEQILINSGDFSGLKFKEAISIVTDSLEKRGIGKSSKQYKLNDWCISRQRYWGTPIPMVNCDNCGIVPEKEENLPIELPIIDDYKLSNNGKSPLSLLPGFVNTKCPCCGGDAKRETDVMDNFFDSSWYFLRYLSPHKDDGAFDLKRANKWLPVDTYIGGNEHAVLHLMYTRFVTKFLHDLGLVDFNEPFKKFFAHGLIIKDGKKMSKSKGNVINPDDYIHEYGADALRTYLMFLGPLEKGGDFTDSGIVSIRKFLGKVYKFLLSSQLDANEFSLGGKQEVNEFLDQFDHSMSNYKYNVAISKLMVYFSALQKKDVIHKEELSIFLKALSIFSPYMSEEIWNSMIDSESSVHQKGGLSKYENIAGEVKTHKLAIQVCGKLRGVLELSGKLEEEDVVLMAKDSDNIAKHLNGKSIKRVIYVKGKILNIITD